MHGYANMAVSGFLAKRLAMIGLCVVLSLTTVAANADNEFRERSLVNKAEFMQMPQGFVIDGNLHFFLSGRAREALYKGVPLSWLVIVELREQIGFWHEVAVHQELPYQLQYHALLNQYSVKTPSGEERFLTLNAALMHMNSLHVQIPQTSMDDDAEPPYQLAVRIQFNYDMLPVPLRAFAHLEHHWRLSSDWYLWPSQE
jgi:Domain of unknown function (DUF4390)